MKAVQFDAFGPAHTVSYCTDVPDPGPPASDEVIVDVVAFPINPADVLTIEGKYAAQPPLPYTPGAEGIGRISAVGADVDELSTGESVILLGRENWVQKRRVKAAEVLKIEVQSDRLLQYAMLKVNPATAALMLREYVNLKAGDWVIQDAANSGVGHCLIQLARKAGIKTVNVVRRESLDDLGERVNAATAGGNVRLAIDAVAGNTSLRLAECLSDGGMMVNYGMLSGEPCMVMPDWVVFRHLTLTGFWLSTHLGQMSRDQKERLYQELSDDVRDGTLNVNIEATYDINNIKDALAHAARQSRDGKIIVFPNGEA